MQPLPGAGQQGATGFGAAFPAEGDPVGPDGALARGWAGEPWASSPSPGDLGRAGRWAALALEVQARQEAVARALPRGLLTAYAESTAALTIIP